MKRIIIAAAFLAGFNFGFSQETKTEDKDLMTWYHKDFSTTNVYGVNTKNAYKFFESKGLKPKTVVVGVIDSGVEVDHPGLIKNMWKNVNEVPNNGKDDDGNGYVDDVNGWNFVSNSNEIKMDHSLFTDDAMVFDGIKAKSATLSAGGRGVRLDYQDFENLFDDACIKWNSNFINKKTACTFDFHYYSDCNLWYLVSGGIKF